MTFDGYVERIEFHLERLDVAKRPTRQEYVDAWNNQIPAKKMAGAFARRHGKRHATRMTLTDRLKFVGGTGRSADPNAREVGFRS